MIAKISSFSNQFEPELVRAGKTIFEKGKVDRLTKEEGNYHAQVTDTKKYKVTVHVEEGFATAVFCPCGPALCRHVISVFFALQKHLKIKTEPFDKTSFDPPSHALLTQRLNHIVYASGAAGSKDGEREEPVRHVTLNEADIAEFRAMVKNGLAYPRGKSKDPVLTGAIHLLEKAILKYGEKDYDYVFAIAKTVLTEICRKKMYGTSAYDCAKFAIELFNTLCIDPAVPAEMRKEVFGRVLFACRKELYDNYHTQLLAILTNPRLDKDLQEFITREFTDFLSRDDYIHTWVVTPRHRYWQQVSKEKELQLQLVLLANSGDFREKLIEQAFAREDYRTVKILVRNGVYSDPKRQEKWNDWNYKVANKELEDSFSRRSCKDRFFNQGYSMVDYTLCRLTYSDEEWAKELPDWLARFKKNESNEFSKEQIFALAMIYIREEMVDELLALLQKHCSFILLQLAGQLLLRNHAEALMTIYRKWFIAMADQCAQREPAIQLREMLESVRNTRRGKKMVKELVPHLLALHPTWKEFGEEISKLL
jgi:hypothetical protein